MKDEMIRELKTYLGDDRFLFHEKSYGVCVERAIRVFKTKRNYPDYYSECRIHSDMDKYYYCIFDLALYFLMKQGAEFQSIHIENNTHRTYQNEHDIFAAHNVVSFVDFF